MSAEVVTTGGLDYVLLPHRADWSTEPQLSRRWETKVALGLTGIEERSAVRAVPVHTLRWSVTTLNEQEEARVEARMQAAKRSGRAAAPWFGRGMRIVTAASGASTVTVASSPWLPAAGDFVIILEQSDASQPSFDVRTVASVAGNVITIDDPLSRTWRAGTLCYPMIVGAFTGDTHPMIAGYLGAWTFAIEQDAPPTLPIGVCPPPAELTYGIYHGRVGLDAEGEWIQDFNDLLDMEKLFWGGLENNKLTHVEQVELPGTYLYTGIPGDLVQTIAYSGINASPADVPWGPVGIPVLKFDSSIYGTPLSVEVVYSLAISAGLKVENVNIPALTAVISIAGDGSFYWPSSNPIDTLTTTVPTSVSLPTYDGTLDYDGTSGATFPVTGSSSASETITSSSPEWASLIGSGGVTFNSDGAANVHVTTVVSDNEPAVDIESQTVEVSVGMIWHYHPLPGFWVFAIADEAPWEPLTFSIDMASLAELGGAGAGRGETNGFGWQQVEDFHGHLFKVFRSKEQVATGDGEVTVT